MSVSFALIFSHSEGYLFTLLIVSFAVQKLLSLIRSHLLFFKISITLGDGSKRIRSCGIFKLRYEHWFFRYSVTAHLIDYSTV